MTAVEIKPVRTASERRAFIKLAWPLYAGDPHWVPPLIGDMKRFIHPRKGVFFDSGEAELFIAYRDGRPVGRISAQINHRHDACYDDDKGFFGFFECEEDPVAARALFDAAESYLRARGRRVVEGPLSFSIYDEIGILVDGFDSTPYVLNLHHPPYYGALIEEAGYAKEVDWYAFRIDADAARARWSEKLKKLRTRVLRRQGMTLRTVELKHFERDAAHVKQIFDAAWSPNYGHLPLSDGEFARLAEGLKHLVIPELTFIAEVAGEPVGFALSIYDANLTLQKIDGRLFPLGFVKLLRDVKKARRFRLMLLGVLESYQGRGYEIVFSTEVMERGLELGFTECEMSNIVETNEPMLRSLGHLPSERYKTYRIYSKTLA